MNVGLKALRGLPRLLPLALPALELDVVGAAAVATVAAHAAETAAATASAAGTALVEDAHVVQTSAVRVAEDLERFVAALPLATATLQRQAIDHIWLTTTHQGATPRCLQRFD